MPVQHFVNPGQLVQAVHALKNQGSHASLKVLESELLGFESPGIFVPCNTVICGYSCWNDQHFVTGIVEYTHLLCTFTYLKKLNALLFVAVIEVRVLKK